jgi:DtxR family Mn-dependent transcriptional regulator
MYSVVEENYLKALLNLCNADDEVSINDLSKRLNIKMPSVNSMMKRFAEKELVTYESYKPVKLSAKGKKEASMIIRKHRLTEMFLVEKMDFNWEEVHEIAEQIEHIQSPLFFEKMDALLGYPKFDPHGSPIPDKNGKVIKTSYVPLNVCEAGKVVTLKAVSDSSEAFLRFLNGRSILLGDQLKVLSKEPFDGSMQIEVVGKSTEVFSELICEKLLVEKA